MCLFFIKDIFLFHCSIVINKVQHGIIFYRTCSSKNVHYSNNFSVRRIDLCYGGGIAGQIGNKKSAIKSRACTNLALELPPGNQVCASPG